MSGVVCSSESTSRADTGPKIGFAQRSDTSDAELRNHTHIISPLVARDTLILDTLIPGIGSSATSGSPQHASASLSSVKPIYHARAPTRRPSLPTCACTSQSSTRLLEQAQPIFDGLVELYLENLHPCLPLLDEQRLRSLFSKRSTLPKTFLVVFVAYMAFYWRKQHDTVIDVDFAWQAVVEAMNGDSQRSDMYSLLAIALCIAGRPSVGVVHNTGNVARITALAHSVGMNHDCSEWSLSASEKDARCKLWWTILIHDRWFNFAQGTPPYINRDHYDVSIPTMEMLCIQSSGTNRQSDAAKCYIQLCKLTEIVGDILPIIYHVRSGNDAAAAGRRLQADTALENWLEEQPEGFNLQDVGKRQHILGLPNLQLSYLATRMLLRRIAWHEDAHQDESTESLWLQECMSAAEDVTRFVQSLRRHELEGFWLPYNAYHFSSAVTLLLRCVVQTKSKACLETAMSSARELVSTLSSFQGAYHWDMATNILPQSERMLHKVEEVLPAISARLLDQLPLQSTSEDDGLQQVNNAQWNMQEQRFSSHDFQTQDSIEAMFPELFSEFADNAFLDVIF